MSSYYCILYVVLRIVLAVCLTDWITLLVSSKRTFVIYVLISDMNFEAKLVDNKSDRTKRLENRSEKSFEKTFVF